MKVFYIYMLLCVDGSIYTGITSDLASRLVSHQAGKHKKAYTYNRRPVKLIYHETFMRFDQAEFFEKKIKRWSNSKKKALADGDAELPKELAECKNESRSSNK